jgi:hypothetical protein
MAIPYLLHNVTKRAVMMLTTWNMSESENEKEMEVKKRNFRCLLR